MTQTTETNETAAGDDIRMEFLQTALDFERDLGRRGLAPDTERLPHVRSRAKFEIIAATLLALGVAGMALLGNFLVFNEILHWSF